MFSKQVTGSPRAFGAHGGISFAVSPATGIMKVGPAVCDVQTDDRRSGLPTRVALDGLRLDKFVPDVLGLQIAFPKITRVLLWNEKICILRRHE